MPSLAFFVSSLSAGGAERVVAELANALAADGWRVAIVTLAEEEADHYSVRPDIKRISLGLMRNSRGVGSALWNNLRRVSMLRRELLAWDPDAAVGFSEKSNVLLLLALSGTGIPIVVSERVDPRRHHIGLAWSIARRLSYPLAAIVVVQTETVANWAKRFLRSDRIAIMPNPVRNLPVAASDVPRSKVILGVGRLDHQKGFDLLIRAFALSKSVSMGYRLVILGDGPQRSTLESLVRELGLARYVELPGVVDSPEAWMEKAAIFVAPSRYEGFPNALLEAMAMCCPVICTDCESGPRDIVQTGTSGLLVPVEDVDSLRCAIDDLLSDAMRRAALGQAAAQVRDRYALDSIAARWKQMLEDVIIESRTHA